MCWIVQFLSEWQTLIGSAIGAILAIGGSLWVTSRRLKVEEEKNKAKSYQTMIAILYEIKHIIGRFELYLDFKYNKKNDIPQPTISFNRIYTPTYSNRTSDIIIPEISFEVYDGIQKIYTISEVVRLNIEKSYVVKTIKTKEDKQTVYIQERTVSKFYWTATAFMEHYLEDMYIKFNFIYDKIKNFSKKNNFKFPDNINKYEKKYINEKVKKYNLLKIKLDS